MASASTAIDTSNPRLLQERIESIRAQIAQFQDEIDKYADVAATITELPKKLQHHVMVPIGKRAMMPGKIVRSNEILAHLGDEYFAWKTAGDAVDVIERKKKALATKIHSEQNALSELEEKKQEVDKLFDIKKARFRLWLYEDENIKDIQESEEDSERYPVTQATEADVAEYFEIEGEERRQNEAADWDWDDVMKRMEELELMEERGDDLDEETKEEAKPAPTVEEQVSELKAKGNEAFGKRRFKESLEFYSQGITLDPQSHILYGNRSAAYFRLKKYREALSDAHRAVELDAEWVKGHYRKASALAALERYEEAAAAFDEAYKRCPTDAKLQEQADEMRSKARSFKPQKRVSFGLDEKKILAPKATVAAAVGAPPPTAPKVPAAPPAAAANTVAAKVFTGSIMERASVERLAPVVAAAADVPARRSRFLGNNPDGDVVTLEPVGEAQPVKRVSRFRAQRAGQQ